MGSKAGHGFEAPLAGLLRLFAKFLGFGIRAWGGPVAQIGLMHRELVERERWVDEATFRRVLGVYQILPGPEATELAIYFGVSRAGRLGGLLAGLGFILPGFLLTMAAAVLYVAYGRSAPGVTGLFYAAQPVVLALLLHALMRLGRVAFATRGLLTVGAAAFLAGLLTDISFVLIGLACGVAYQAVAASRRAPPVAAALAFSFGSALPFPWLFAGFFFVAGSVSFGGAYTVLPFLEQGLVRDLGWVGGDAFVDALAIGGLLPAPLIMVAAFLGHLIAPPWGGPVATVAIFLPAFLITLLFHARLMRLVERPWAHRLFEGITAGVVGLIGVTFLALVPHAVQDGFSLVVGTAAFVGLWAARLRPVIVVLSAMAVGIALEAAGFVAAS